MLSCVNSLWPLWAVACQTSQSLGFPKQEYWSRVPFAPPGDLPNPGIEPTSPALVGRFFTTMPPGKSYVLILDSKLNLIFALSQSSKAVINILKNTLWKNSVQKTCRKTRPMENCLPTTSILHFYTVLAFGKFFHEYATPLAMSVHLINRS